ncbi:beta-lactamase [Shouchella clausii]|nr:beta-lactamase [Shouchella clausii]
MRTLHTRNKSNKQRQTPIRVSAIQLTNRQPRPQITEECPAHYRDGLTFAFNDKQNTVDFYLKAADRASQQIVQEAFRRAAADEQPHAVWFLSFLMRT